MRPALAFVLAAMVSGGNASAQAAAESQSPPPAVFLDCQAAGCDSGHIRNEIRFVHWMRDRNDADVYILVTSQTTGGGGRSYLLTLRGQDRFAGDSTEIRFTTDQASTDVERRDVLTARISQGLVRYAVHTDAAAQLQVGSEPASELQVQDARRRDPWNFWVFSTRLSAEIDGESREQAREFELSFDADRVTEAWKVGLRIEATYDEQEFELTDRTIRSVRRDYETSGEVAFAVGGQWSAGMRADVGTSSFANQDLYARTAGLLEYSFLPYSEFTRRRVTLQYSVGARYFDYAEVTVYDRLTEQRADHQLQFTVEFQQPWGEASVDLSGAHYLDDFERNNLSSRANLNIRLIRGLSLDLFGMYARVRDQIYIPKGDATDEEVLLRRRALETGYRYRTSIGLRYTFGSIYNNVVNPRLAGGGNGDDFNR
ncbi:MAG TPA: hypothetical protein VFZ69_00315 [Longimicrobiales bacterium]